MIYTARCNDHINIFVDVFDGDVVIATVHYRYVDFDLNHVGTTGTLPMRGRAQANAAAKELSEDIRETLLGQT